MTPEDLDQQDSFHGSGETVLGPRSRDPLRQSPKPRPAGEAQASQTLRTTREGQSPRRPRFISRRPGDAFFETSEANGCRMHRHVQWQQSRPPAGCHPCASRDPNHSRRRRRRRDGPCIRRDDNHACRTALAHHPPSSPGLTRGPMRWFGSPTPSRETAASRVSACPACTRARSGRHSPAFPAIRGDRHSPSARCRARRDRACQRDARG